MRVRAVVGAGDELGKWSESVVDALVVSAGLEEDMREDVEEEVAATSK